jgi:hypothetical protein
LTHDLVPVIYHDFVVRLPGYTIPLNRLTLAQFNQLRLHERFPAVHDHKAVTDNGRPRTKSLPNISAQVWVILFLLPDFIFLLMAHSIVGADGGGIFDGCTADVSNHPA